MTRRIVGTRTKLGFCAPFEGGEQVASLRGVLDVQPADQIVTVGAGTPVEELQERLAETGQCLPLPDRRSWGNLLAALPGTVGGMIAMNLPHALSAQCGGPREWLLQAEVEFHGEPAKSGAKVVKNVAGYDVHKVFVGSRGLLGPILSVTLKTVPIASVPVPVAEQVAADSFGPVWIMRTLRTEFEECLRRAQGLLAFDRASCTLWCRERPEPPRCGWIVGPQGFLWHDVANSKLERRLKAVFDPKDEWR